MRHQRFTIIKSYKGYEIVTPYRGVGKDKYYVAYKNGDQFSIMAFGSSLAVERAIDFFIKKGEM